jgi:predicted anti-sigma-YlaC factor YlaD
MMSHIKEEQISAYIDRQLPVDENRSIEIHLQECSSCRTIYDELSTLTQFFQDAERIEPPAFLWNRIAADFDKEHPASHGWVASIIACLRGYSRSLGMAAATIVILIITGIVVNHGNRMPSTDRAALAQIDQIYQDLAAQDPDGYNPFGSGAPGEWEANPFKSMRLNNKSYSVPPGALQH